MCRQRLTAEVERLTSEHLRLETETEELARKLITNKVRILGIID